MYKIYFGKTLVCLLNHKDADGFKKNKNTLYLHDEETGTFQELIERLKMVHKINKIFISASHTKSLFRKLCRETILVKAAGGVVTDASGRLLMIRRFGHWDLPKGKAEKGEKLSETAIREVEEECGISGLSIVKKLEPTFHVYTEKGKWYLKKTAWFHMETSFKGTLTPQTKEHITKVCWFTPKQVHCHPERSETKSKGLLF
jgi:8-oxo-dGTP pyrophosphatase MutT (NUDIX family)